MNCEIIGSSSKGNCIVVEDVLMLDCGVRYYKIKKYLPKVKLIFISHDHLDHLLPTTIKKIAYNYPTIKFLTGSEEVVKKLVDCNINVKNIYVLPSKRDYSYFDSYNTKWYDLGLLKVQLQGLYHDTQNYALKWELNGKKGIYIIDTARVDHIKAKNYDLYLIESNYNEELLNQHIQECIDNGDNENKLYYLHRVPRVHLSDTQCNDFLIENMGSNSEYIKLHQSSYNYKEID